MVTNEDDNPAAFSELLYEVHIDKDFPKVSRVCIQFYGLYLSFYFNPVKRKPYVYPFSRSWKLYEFTRKIKIRSRIPSFTVFFLVSIE